MLNVDGHRIIVGVCFLLICRNHGQLCIACSWALGEHIGAHGFRHWMVLWQTTRPEVDSFQKQKRFIQQVRMRGKSISTCQTGSKWRIWCHLCQSDDTVVYGLHTIQTLCIEWVFKSTSKLPLLKTQQNIQTMIWYQLTTKMWIQSILFTWLW